LLLLSSVVPLEILELKEVRISEADMERLVPALEACPSLTELSLDGVSQPQAAALLVHCLRAKRTSTVCALRHLCLASASRSRLSFASILTGQDHATRSMVSSLKVLRLLDGFEEVGDLLKTLAMGHRLSSLSLERLTGNSWSQLTAQLPNLLYLREFNAAYLMTAAPVDSQPFLRAMRKNGSLHKVSEIASLVVLSQSTFNHRRTPLFNDAELQQIRCYGERNQATHKLLQNPDLCDSGNDAHGDETKTPLSLFPRLFEVMKPARRMAPNYILMGLLACDNGDKVIGPRGRDKRLLVSSC
jgi:hypothetical protein